MFKKVANRKSYRYSSKVYFSFRKQPSNLGRFRLVFVVAVDLSWTSRTLRGWRRVFQITTDARRWGNFCHQTRLGSCWRSNATFASDLTTFWQAEQNNFYARNSNSETSFVRVRIGNALGTFMRRHARVLVLLKIVAIFLRCSHRILEFHSQRCFNLIE